jgi:hypothetical protein
MRWLKLAGWLVFTLIAMRLVSWALAWRTVKLLQLEIRLAAILANLTAFLLFVLLLHWQPEPGEPVDRVAVVFGATVYFVYLGIDCLWVPWRTGTSPTANVASGQKEG